VTSGLRGSVVGGAIGSSETSQQVKVEACDFEWIGVDNAELFD